MLLELVVAATIVCGDGHMGGQVCSTITDPYDGRKIEVGCHSKPCPNWPQDRFNDNDRMIWIGQCWNSDPLSFDTDCPTYLSYAP